jgi:hypothetical protein
VDRYDGLSTPKPDILLDGTRELTQNSPTGGGEAAPCSMVWHGATIRKTAAPLIVWEHEANTMRANVYLGTRTAILVTQSRVLDFCAHPWP